jgi:hypothetical protein
MRYLTSSIAALAILLISISTTHAQAAMKQKQPAKVNPDSISNQELQTFVKTSNDIQTIQMGSVKDIQKAVKDQGMDLQRFRQIMMSMRNPKKNDVKMTPKEKQQFSKIRVSIMKIEQNVNQQMKAKIKSDGMEVARYKQIYMALQQSKDLQQRLQKLNSKK